MLLAVDTSAGQLLGRLKIEIAECAGINLYSLEWILLSGYVGRRPTGPLHGI